MALNLDSILDLAMPVNSKWISKTKILHVDDIITHIRAPVNTTLYVLSEGKSILLAKLEKDVPFVLNLPVFAIVYADVRFEFDPPTDYEQKALCIDSIAKAALFSAKSINIPRHSWVCKDGVILKHPSPEAVMAKSNKVSDLARRDEIH